MSAAVLPPIRWSNLKHMGRSPAHFKYFIDHPVQETDAMRVGSRVHDLVLDGGLHTFAVWEGKTRNGNAWDAFVAQHKGSTILTTAQEERAQTIAAAVKQDPLAELALFAGVPEERRDWEIAGWSCCGTPDSVTPVGIVDLKITRNASPAMFPWHAQKMGWLGQLAWYDYGMFGGNASELTIIAVEDQPPHLVTVYKLSPDAAEMGHRTWRLYFERLKVCQESGVWPGYSDCVVPLNVEGDFTLHIGNEEVTVE